MPRFSYLLLIISQNVSLCLLALIISGKYLLGFFSGTEIRVLLSQDKNLQN
jgi:hypothetical protein